MQMRCEWMAWGLGLLMLLGGFVDKAISAEPGTTVPEATHAVKLPGTTGELHAMLPRETGETTVFCFLGTECPLAKLYGPRLQRLAEEYAEHSVRFVGVCSNLQDSMEKLREYGSTHGLGFPLVKDYDHRLADLLAAERTPEVIVVDAQGVVRYRGRIDDQYRPGAARDKPRQTDLATALAELTAGKEVTTPRTDAVGCLIGRAFEGEVTTSITYCQEVSRLMQKHCVECHRPKEIGPFSLTNYGELLGWGEMLVEVVHEGRMPPWHANPDHGEFANAREMTAAEKAQLREWVEGGMPYGDAAELPEPEEYLDGWQLARVPDQIIPMAKKPYKVAAEGVIDYQYFVTDPGFEEDRWIIGAQVVPGNRAVVHHCIVFVRPPDGTALKGLGWVSAYVPGQRSTMFAPGYARHVPAGSQLVFQMHYTPNGSVQEDLTSLGLLFAEEEEITHEVHVLPAINRNFEIPPHAEDYAVRGQTTHIPRNGEILAMAPHMHYRGKAFQASLIKEGQTEIILDVPYYDFNWQHVYELKQPISLADVNRLNFTARFDNSSRNPFNPDPTAYVTWGDQSWEEMAIAFFEVAIPRGEKLDYAPAEPEIPDAAQQEQEKARQAVEEQEVARFVDQFFERFDKNRDGVISRGEMTIAQQRFGFRGLDRNNDGQLDRDEIATHFRKRLREKNSP